MSHTQLDLLTSPSEFFHKKITEASTHLRVKLDERVEFYLVNLLTKFVSSEVIAGDGVATDDVLSTPLALMLKKAVEAPTEVKPQIYRHLGDSSLYVSGFFQDYFNRKCFDISYYMEMGASAYGQASALSRGQSRDDALQETLDMLAKNFALIVDVVAQASDSSALHQDTTLLNLYDRWNRSGSNRLRMLLEDKGIHPIKVPFKQAQ
jgi:hypothetical protein